jgi:hypothetical protein
MPTNTNAYNSRVTDEALEKRFRDTFKAQGGAELVDDLYAQGVIVPVVDFTAAATGDVLPQNLQTAWDFSTGFSEVQNTTSTLISNAGFWQVDLTLACNVNTFAAKNATIFLDSGVTTKPIWEFNAPAGTANSTIASDGAFVVFLRSNDSLKASTGQNETVLNVWYRQIATSSGDLVDPFGFTSS